MAAHGTGRPNSSCFRGARDPGGRAAIKAALLRSAALLLCLLAGTASPTLTSAEDLGAGSCCVAYRSLDDLLYHLGLEEGGAARSALEVDGVRTLSGLATWARDTHSTDDVVGRGTALGSVSRKRLRREGLRLCDAERLEGVPAPPVSQLQGRYATGLQADYGHFRASLRARGVDALRSEVGGSSRGARRAATEEVQPAVAAAQEDVAFAGTAPLNARWLGTVLTADLASAEDQAHVLAVLAELGVQVVADLGFLAPSDLEPLLGWPLSTRLLQAAAAIGGRGGKGALPPPPPPPPPRSRPAAAESFSSTLIAALEQDIRDASAHHRRNAVFHAETAYRDVLARLAAAVSRESFLSRSRVAAAVATATRGAAAEGGGLDTACLVGEEGQAEEDREVEEVEEEEEEEEEERTVAAAAARRLASSTLLHLGMLLSQLGRHSEARCVYLGVLCVDPKHGAAVHNLAVAVSALETSNFVRRHHIPLAPTLHAALDHAVSTAPSQGLILEFGVFEGSSIRRIFEIVSNHPDLEAGAVAERDGGVDLTTAAGQIQRGPRQVHGFDAWLGLPDDWVLTDSVTQPRGSFATQHGPPDDLPHGVVLHMGWFNSTVAAFERTLAPAETIAFVHIDCDLYSSTVEALGPLACRLGPGSVVAFDEYFDYPNWQQHEAKAWDEIVQQYGIPFRYLIHHKMRMAVVVTARGSRCPPTTAATPPEKAAAHKDT